MLKVASESVQRQQGYSRSASIFVSMNEGQREALDAANDAGLRRLLESVRLADE